MRTMYLIWGILSLTMIIASILLSIRLVQEIRESYIKRTLLKELETEKPVRRVDILKPVKKAIKKLDERVNKNE